MTDKQIIEINEQIKKAIQRIENIGKKYDELREKYKAKEQECEELNRQLISFMNGDYCVNGCSLQQQLSKLKAENDELKKEINNKYSVSNFNVIFMREHIHNLKQALKEIKEIAEKEIACDDCNFQGTGECASSCPSFYLDDFCKSLLQKISEVIDDKAN